MLIFSMIEAYIKSKPLKINIPSDKSKISNSKICETTSGPTYKKSKLLKNKWFFLTEPSPNFTTIEINSN